MTAPKNAAAVYGKRYESGTTILDRRRPFDGKCESCGKKKDLRPYGRAGEWICFKCGMKDEETTKRRFGQVVFKEDLE